MYLVERRVADCEVYLPPVLCTLEQVLFLSLLEELDAGAEVVPADVVNGGLFSGRGGNSRGGRV